MKKKIFSWIIRFCLHRLSYQWIEGSILAEIPDDEGFAEIRFKTTGIGKFMIIGLDGLDIAEITEYAKSNGQYLYLDDLTPPQP